MIKKARIWLAGLLKRLGEKLERIEEPQKTSKKKEQFVFKPAQRYEMYVVGKPGVVYKGRIEDVKDDILILSAPVEKSVPVFLSKGTEVVLAIIGLPSGRYEFKTTVIDAKEVSAGIPEVFLKKPTVIYRKQRRTKPRARFFCKVVYQIVESSLSKRVDMPFRGKTDAWDLSAVGIALLFVEELPLHTRLKINFVIPDMGIPVTAICEVVNSRWEEYSRKYITGLLFVDILEEDRAHIDKYVGMLLPTQVDGLLM